MTVKPFSESEIEHYRAMVGLIINGDAKKKREVDDQARLAIAQAKKNMPTADNETLVTFFASIAFLMAHLMTVQVKNLTELMESTFDGYTIAAAHLMKSYDIDGDEIPVKRDYAGPSPVADDINIGQYL